MQLAKTTKKKKSACTGKRCFLCIPINFLCTTKKLKKLLQLAKTNHTYKVLTEYENPLTFIDELKEYYHDRIYKLKKRTRKASMFDSVSYTHLTLPTIYSV